MPRIVLQTQKAPVGHWLQAARRGLLALALVALAAPALALDGPQRLPTVTLGSGILNIKAELAQNPREHEIGLMHRTSMGANEGMLFVFDRIGVQCFWMKNTLIPLSVAFIAEDGSVVNIDEMKPETLDSHCSTRPVRFVLEMNTGWFKRHGVKAGDKLSGAPFGTPR
jgi:uncharacterized membrane protein (UPF0127 family)